MNGRYSLGLYEKSMPSTLSWGEKLQAAKASGFDFVEISIDETEEKLSRLDMPPSGRLALLAQMQEAGIRLETMCLSGHRKYPLGSTDPAVRARGMEIMERAILLARELGIRIIQLAGYDVYYDPPSEETHALFADSLEKSVIYAASHGVLLAFETMETPFMNTVAKAMYWVKRNPSPYLAVYPDTGNLTNAALAAGGEVLADIETGRGYLAAVHLKESVPGKYREIPYGTGHVAFEAIIRKTYGMGVRRYLAEFWHTGQSDWEAELSHANRFLREKFAAAGI